MVRTAMGDSAPAVAVVQRSPSLSPQTACRALLQRMAPEHKFATAAKLCGEVLGGVADGLLPLEQCQEVLGDALRCLASKDIKVTPLMRHACMHAPPHYLASD